MLLEMQDSRALLAPPGQEYLVHSQHTLSCLLSNPGICFHRPRPDWVVGYISHGRVDIVIGGLLAPMQYREQLLSSYLADAANRRATPVWVHFGFEDAKLLNSQGFQVNQLGASYSVPIVDYDMAGKNFQQLRNKINRAKKAGIEVRVVQTAPEFAALRPTLKTINAKWLAQKGAKPLKGLVTDFDNLEIPSDHYRVYVAYEHTSPIAYIVYTRTWGFRQGWFHDLSRKLPDAQDGVMQLINETALHDFRAEKTLYLHFGFTPLVEMGAPLSINGSTMFDRIANWMARKGGVVYPAAAQRQYKMSWRPKIIEPELIAFRQGQALSALWAILRSTNSI